MYSLVRTFWTNVDLRLPNYRIYTSSTKLSYILVSWKNNRGCSSIFIQVQWELHANEVRVVHLIDVIVSNPV
jgi:hypothetical protein